MNEQTLQREIQNRVEKKLFPLLEEYSLDSGELAMVLKWKPIVLLLGNYSSGKSTLINELLDQEIQLTGQAPTDDSFTVITAPASNEKYGLVNGASLVNDDQLPFSRLKAYGEKLSSHFQMKLIDSPLLENLAIIDTPGMLDSVTEKGRGYDFTKVIGEFALISDLVVLMFDPHKAGTIKETYTTIRGTLPETSAEDRVVYVMSRIDECDNLGDLIRSYGTLCWNLSQMTGRKDIPRIFLTFSPTVRRKTKALEAWVDERNQLKDKILAAPGHKISHILHLLDRKLHELKLVTEAMAGFTKGGRRVLRRAFKKTIIGGIGAFVLIDLFFAMMTGSAARSFLLGLLSGTGAIHSLALPLMGTLIYGVVSVLWVTKWRLPRYFSACREDIDGIVSLTTPYQEYIWQRVRNTVSALISKPDIGIRTLRYPHQKNLERVDRFIREDLKKYFSVDRLIEIESDEPAARVPPDGQYDMVDHAADARRSVLPPEAP